MKKQILWIMALSFCIIIILPWSIVKWQNGQTSDTDFEIRILKDGGQIDKMPLEDYLIGVVAAEMPAEFEPEALKAQAVAARTYAAKRLSHITLPDAGYDVDTTVKTQAWISESEMRQKWKFFSYWRYKAKIKKAVMETKGQVLVYNGDYVDAFYYSSAGRKATERSEEVWSSPRPYLINVNAEENEPMRFVKKYEYTFQEFYKRLSLPGNPRALTVNDLKIISRTAAGRVKKISICGKLFTGPQMRSLLEMASTDIEWELKDKSIVLITYGNGHAVGMSQYGANDMANKEKDYRYILQYYYPGAKILSLKRAG